MTRKIYPLFITLSLLLASGCQKEEGPSSPNDLFSFISFTSVGSAVVNTVSRASAVFPHDGTIGVFAANCTNNAANWNNLYINDKSAKTNSQSFPFDFVWEEAVAQWCYWPFDSEKHLVFTAYAPFTDRCFSKQGRVLTIERSNVTPLIDILYTDCTAPLNKTMNRGKVDLGSFKHALAQLEIEILAVDKSGDEIIDTDGIKSTIESLALKTKNKSALLTVGSGTAAITNTPALNYSEYKIISTPTSFNKKDIPSILMFPYSPIADDSNIVFEMQIHLRTNTTETPIVLDTEMKISDFKSANGTAISFNAGEKTRLTIKVKNIDTDNDLKVELTGNITDWDYKGDSNVTIE